METAQCRYCGIEIIWMDVAGKKRPYDRMPNGAGGWDAGTPHWQTCPAEKYKREKKACILCRLAQSENPFDLILETDLSNIVICDEDKFNGSKYLPSIHRTVKASIEGLIDFRREARRWKRRTQKLAKAAEGTARLL